VRLVIEVTVYMALMHTLTLETSEICVIRAGAREIKALEVSLKAAVKTMMPILVVIGI
jgi:hypothetical protein